MRHSLASRKKKAKKKKGRQKHFSGGGSLIFVEFPKKVKVHEPRTMAHST